MNAQKSDAKKTITKETSVSQKDNWQEYKYQDFSVKFPNKPATAENVSKSALKSVRYSATDSDGVKYSVDQLKFDEEFGKTSEVYDAEKTIYDNLELQWTEKIGVRLLFRTDTFVQSVRGRTWLFELKEENAEVLNVMQNAYIIDDRVYIVRAIMPLKLMRDEKTGLKDFPPSVNIFLNSFRFLNLKEDNNRPPPPPPPPGPKKTSGDGKKADKEYK